jgi:dihydropyrimidine dehydrogenase (NAD+) subunit PreA
MPVVNGKSSISGYSGAAVKPIGLRFIAQMKQHPLLKNIQMSGIGGIETWRDALEYILVGCHNVQVTTAVMQYGYRIVSDMISGLSYYMEEEGFEKVEDMVGLALPNIIPAEELQRNFKIIVDIDHDLCIGCGRCYISCFDAAHQAINWDFENRRPTINDECVGCHLCINVCPVLNCIRPAKIVWKEDWKITPEEINFKTRYE